MQTKGVLSLKLFLDKILLKSLELCIDILDEYISIFQTEGRW